MSLAGQPLLVAHAEAIAPALQGGPATLLVPAHLARIAASVARQAAAASAVFATGAEPSFGAWEDVAGVLCRSATPQSIERLSGELAVAEAEHGLDEGRLRILGLIDDAVSVMALGGLQARDDRLDGFILDRAAIALALGVAATCDTLRVAAGMVVLAAKGLGVPAIDGATPCMPDRGFRKTAEIARGNGFAGKLAATLDELGIAREVFGASGTCG